MSTQTYDIVIMIGVIALVAVIIFWATRYGATVVEDIMQESPLVLQSSFASYASGACGVDGNLSVSHGLTKPIPLYVFMNATHVQIRPVEATYYEPGETERGGSISFTTKPAQVFINCGVNIIRKNVRFNQNVHHDITLNKTDNRMQIGVK